MALVVFDGRYFFEAGNERGSLPQQFGHLRHVSRDPQRLLYGEQFVLLKRWPGR
jgi:hypothetical protein